MNNIQKFALGAVAIMGAFGVIETAEAQQYYYPQQGYYYQQPPAYVSPRVQRKQQQLSDRFIEKYGYQQPQYNYGYQQPRYYQPQPRYYQPQPQYGYGQQRYYRQQQQQWQGGSRGGLLQDN